MSHLHAFGSKGERSSHRGAVGDPSGSNERNVDLLRNQWEQHHRGHLRFAPEAGALDTLHDETVDTCVDRFLRGVERRDHMEDSETRGFQNRRIGRWGAGRSRHEGNTLGDQHVGDLWISHKGNRQVDAERMVCHIAYPLDILPSPFDADRARYEPNATRLSDCSHQRRIGNKTHGRIRYRDVDSKQLRDAVVEVRQWHSQIS